VISDAVEFPLLFPSTPSYPMAAIETPVHPSSPAEVDTKRGMLAFRLFPIEGVVVFDLVSIYWRSKVFGIVGTCIFHAPGCVMFG
jgi:hypothetical protein